MIDYKYFMIYIVKKLKKCGKQEKNEISLIIQIWMLLISTI